MRHCRGSNLTVVSCGSVGPKHVRALEHDNARTILGGYPAPSLATVLILNALRRRDRGNNTVEGRVSLGLIRFPPDEYIPSSGPKYLNGPGYHTRRGPAT